MPAMRRRLLLNDRAGIAMLTDRRSLLLGGLALSALPLSACAPSSPEPNAQEGAAKEAVPLPDIAAALAALEASSGSTRLGIAVLDARDGAVAGYRVDERFTMCSTFKLSLAAAVLAKIDAGSYARNLALPLTADEAVGHAPVVKAALAQGTRSMDILTLAKAAQVESDNGAANILLRHIGGPEALTAFWRTLGDDVTRLDRYEPQLNTSHGSDFRDTTSPSAMADSLRAIFEGDVLKSDSRDLLIGWMIETRTGLKRLRGGLPVDWRAGDKTGTNPGDGSYASKANDVAILWHPARAEPFFITGFLESPIKGEPATRPEHDAVLAQAGRIAAKWIEARVTLAQK